jgi:Cdc6-like AAA superfamily ATPase
MYMELPIEKLRRMCELDELGCDTSQHPQRLDTIIGQERAVRALRFGLGIKETGFNIFVSGLPGTGRTTAVEQFLEQVAQDQPVPNDWCYVNSFRDPYRPKALRLPAGRAQALQEDLQRLVETARHELQTVFDSEEYAAKKEEIVKSFQRRRDDIFEQMSERARQEGFVIQFSPLGLLTVPLRAYSLSWKSSCGEERAWARR